MTPMRPVRALFIGLAFLGILWAAPTTAAEVQEPRWGFSTDLGLWSGTTNDTTNPRNAGRCCTNKACTCAVCSSVDIQV